MRLKASTVGEDLMVCGNWFQKVGLNTLNNPSPICLLLFGMVRRVMPRFERRPSLEGMWVVIQEIQPIANSSKGQSILNIYLKFKITTNVSGRGYKKKTFKMKITRGELKKGIDVPLQTV